MALLKAPCQLQRCSSAPTAACALNSASELSQALRNSSNHHHLQLLHQFYTMRQSAALLIVLLTAPALVNCYPTLWAGRVLPDEVLKGAKLTPENCILHPKTKEAAHQAPVADKAITITAVDASGKAVKELCPGVDYTVTVKYPEARRTLLTTTQGAWATANATCPGRVYTPRTGKGAETFNATVTVPCNTTASSTILQVTSAAGPAAAFKQASVQMNIASLAKCPTSTCAAADNETLLAAANTTASLNETAVTEDNVTTASNLTAPANATGAAAGTKGADASKGPAAAPAPAAKSAAFASPVSMLAAAAAVMSAIAAML